MGFDPLTESFNEVPLLLSSKPNDPFRAEIEAIFNKNLVNETQDSLPGKYEGACMNVEMEVVQPEDDAMSIIHIEDELTKEELAGDCLQLEGKYFTSQFYGRRKPHRIGQSSSYLGKSEHHQTE